jgi:RNA polymerase sigma factor (sigma-70 family)
MNTAPVAKGAVIVTRGFVSDRMVDQGAGLAASHSSRAQRLEALALRYREALVRYFVRRGVAVDASEDCAHEVFVRLARTDDQTIENAEAYLFAIASSVLITRARKAKSRRESHHAPIEDFTLVSGEASADRVLEGREAVGRLVAALSELPAETREMFLLNREDGLTYAQIGARRGLGVKAVERHIGKALHHLRQRLPRHD